MLKYTNGAVLLGKVEVRQLLEFAEEVAAMHIHEGDALHARALEIAQLLTESTETVQGYKKSYGSV